MDAREFFLEEYDTVRSIVNDLFLKGVTDDQMRHQPKEGLNSIAWYLWHTARWQDFANTLIETNRPQVLDEQWLARIKVSRRDVGTGMTREECTVFNESVDITDCGPIGRLLVTQFVRLRDQFRPTILANRWTPHVFTGCLKMAQSQTREHGGCRLSLRVKAKVGSYPWRSGTRRSISLGA